MRPVKEESDDKVIDFLLYEGHYCVINSLSRLLRSQYTKHKNKVNVYRNCFNHFYDKYFEEHKNVCFSNEGSIAIMPTHEKVCKFKNYHKEFKLPFVIYADFESFNKMIVDEESKMSEETKQRLL